MELIRVYQNVIHSVEIIRFSENGRASMFTLPDGSEFFVTGSQVDHYDLIYVYVGGERIILFDKNTE